jgi:nucleotide-binding universal stress UspA family protein
VVTGVHVVTPSRLSGKQPNIALDVTADFEIVATRMGQHAETEVREAEDVETGILEAVEDFGADLLILGSSVRAGTTHLHLGPRVEYLTRLAPCPVVILTASKPAAPAGLGAQTAVTARSPARSQHAA